MVDVVFKKALKEFRINIFNSYSTALAVSLTPSFSLSLLSHNQEDFKNRDAAT